MFLQLSQPEDLKAYKESLKNATGATLWQSLEWKQYQEALGRETRLYSLKREDKGATALVIIDKTALGFSTWDIPRGPLGSDPEAIQELLLGITEEARKERCMAIYLSPVSEFRVFSFEFLVSKLKTKNYQLATSFRHEQPEATLVLDLTKSEEEILSAMKPKGRYNIGVAEKHGVSVERSDDINAFYELLRGTSERDAFGILPKRHYEHFLKSLPGSFLLMAYAPLSSTESAEGGRMERPLDVRRRRTLEESQKKPLAGLLGVIWGTRGYYYYGASSYAERALMAPYALQWEAIKLCKRKGCVMYDFLGISPPLPHQEESIEQSAKERVSRAPLLKHIFVERWAHGRKTYRLSSHERHPWSGVTRFKMQFGGSVERYPPEQEIILKPATKIVLDWKRRLIG